MYDSYVIKRMAIQLANDIQAVADRADDEMQEQLELQNDLLNSAHAHNTKTLELIHNCLSVHTEHLPEGSADEILEGGAKRILALSKLEDCLYYYSNGLVVDLRKYTDSLFSHMVSEASVASETITTINAVDVGFVPVNLASPLAIVIFELVENCLLHAFDGSSPANYLQVTLTVDAGNPAKDCPYTLRVSDNGIGLSVGIPETEFMGSGLAIVQAIGAQFGAEITLESVNGTQVSLVFYGPQPQ